VVGSQQQQPVFQMHLKSSDSSLRVLTTSIENMKHYSSLHRDKLPLLFEIFGLFVCNMCNDCHVYSCVKIVKYSMLLLLLFIVNIKT